MRCWHCVASLVLRSSSVTFAPRAKSAINSTWQDSSYRVGTDQNTISRVAHWIGNLIWKCFVSKICPLGNRSPDFGPMPGGHPAGAIVSDTQLGLCLRRTSPTASRGGPLRPLRTSGASGLTPFPLFSSFFFEHRSSLFSGNGVSGTNLKNQSSIASRCLNHHRSH